MRPELSATFSQTATCAAVRRRLLGEFAGPLEPCAKRKTTGGNTARAVLPPRQTAGLRAVGACRARERSGAGKFAPLRAGGERASIQFIGDRRDEEEPPLWRAARARARRAGLMRRTDRDGRANALFVLFCSHCKWNGREWNGSPRRTNPNL